MDSGSLCRATSRGVSLYIVCEIQVHISVTKKRKNHTNIPFLDSFRSGLRVQDSPKGLSVAGKPDYLLLLFSTPRSRNVFLLESRKLTLLGNFLIVFFFIVVSSILAYDMYGKKPGIIIRLIRCIFIIFTN